MNIECMFSKQIIDINEIFYLIPLKKVSSFVPVTLIKEKKQYNILGMTESKCYTNAYYEYAGCLIQVKLNDNSEFELIENNTNYSHFLFLLGNLSSEFNELSHLFIQHEDYTFNQLNFILNKIFNLIQNGFIISSQETVLTFGVIKENVIEQALNFKDSILRKDNYFKSLKERIIKVFNKYEEQKPNITLRDFILTNFNFFDYHNESTMDLSSNYPFDLFGIFTILSQETIDGIYTEEGREKLLKEIENYLQKYITHVQLDMLFECLNFKIKPIVFTSSDCSKDYLKMVNFVKNKINKDIKNKYSD